ncbi:MAG: T9SS type A sorting domain-containing protein [Balneolaceae bacterium]|nr:T9SS type A sorting domain-containing protein [Balneolaceae bacterium]
MFFYLSVILISLTSIKLVAQIRTEGTPKSQQTSLQLDIQTKLLSNIDVQALIDEDELDKSSDRVRPPRFGYGREVDYGLDNSGLWSELVDGRVWRLRIESPNASTIGLIFREFFIPDSATLFVYNDDKSEVIGAFTSLNNKPYGKFSIQPITGSAVTLEYFEPNKMRGQGILNISSVVHGYKSVFSNENMKGKFGDSSSCNLNVNCSQANSWQDEKHSVTMIITDSGQRICSGALINNKSENYTPYYLTAYHCGDVNLDGNLSSSELNDVESWIFMFNYESPTCSNIDGPTYQTISGATFRSARNISDFLLLELSITPPPNYYPYYAGWSRLTSYPSSVVGIHHPRADIKKFAQDSDTPTKSLSNTHWYVSNWDIGTTEPGSSGSPLFDQNGRIIGQDHAGNGYSGCDPNKGTHYGALFSSWNGGGTSSTRLKDWLDPNNTGATTMNGMYGPVEAHINGLTVVSPGSYGSWTAETNSGNTPFTYKWYKATNPFFGPWTQVSSSSSYGQSVNSAFYLKLVVTDSKSSTDEDIEYISTTGCVGCPDPKIIPYNFSELPENFVLKQNYPNPFNPSTTITFEIPEKIHVNLTVFDVLGREVALLIDKEMSAGSYEIVWEASSLPSGVYIAKLQAGSFETSIQLLLQK